MDLHHFLEGPVVDKKAFAKEGERSALEDVDRQRRLDLTELVRALARVGAGAAHRMQATDWGVIAPNASKSQYLERGPYAQKAEEGEEDKFATKWRAWAGTVGDNAPDWPSMCADLDTFDSHRFYVL